MGPPLSAGRKPAGDMAVSQCFLQKQLKPVMNPGKKESNLRELGATPRHKLQGTPTRQ